MQKRVRVRVRVMGREMLCYVMLCYLMLGHRDESIVGLDKMNGVHSMAI